MADSARAERPTLVAIRAERARILDAARRLGLGNVRVFGSVARGEGRSGSDVDFVVDLPAGARGFDAFGLLEEYRAELESILGCSVDVVTVPKGLSPHGALIAEAIEHDAVSL